MRRKDTISLILGGAIVVLFALGLLRLFMWRFDIGDIYPPYSSYRRDPLGCMALYESLNKVPGVEAVRFTDYSADLPDGQKTCLLILGVTQSLRGSTEDMEQLDRFIADGGRVILALAPPDRWDRLLESDERTCGTDGCPAPDEDAEKKAPEQNSAEDSGQEPKADGKPAQAENKDQADDNEEDPCTTCRRKAGVRLVSHWGIQVEPKMLTRKDGQWPTVTRVSDSDRLPADLPWHGSAVLRLGHADWEPIYVGEKFPVVARRRLGLGSLIVTTDAYYLSNEALRRSLQARFLSWLIGPSTRVIFEETHFGIGTQKGLVGLARSYGLTGFFLSILALAALFVWQNASRFLPPVQDSENADRAGLGRAADTALPDLLRRHIRMNSLLEQCLSTWNQSAPTGSRKTSRQLARMRQTIAAYQAEPNHRRNRVNVYNQLVEIAHERTSHDA